MKNPQPKWKGIRKQIKGTIMNISMQHISKDVFFYAKNNAVDNQVVRKKLKNNCNSVWKIGKKFVLLYCND